MKIAIDASRAINETAGIGRYTRELVKKMITLDKKNEYLLFFTYFRPDFRKQKLINSFRAPRVTIKTLKIPGSLKEKAWRWKINWLGRFLGKADVFFAPSFFEVNFGLKIPQVVTLHDLTTFIYPEQRGQEVSQRLSKRVKEVTKIAKKVICVSSSTAQDAQKYLNLKENKIKVIYPGLTEINGNQAKLPNGLKSKKFILFVGTIEPRKNLIGLFKAYTLLSPKITEQYPLVIVGAAGWNTGGLFDAYKALNLAGKVKFLGFVSDSILAKLYQEAALFVYPSIYEGFGLPILESFSAGTPVVTSNISSLPEVAGEAAILVDPANTRELSEAMQKILEHKTDSEKLISLGKEQVKKFSWEKAALQTLKVLEESSKFKNQSSK